ncbi:MAG: heparinase II/III family protein, partial [Kiritimatiellaeota bacterium]|nr:heparinase II/III family protein [Kiritimatiellota bacterium]
MENIGGYGTFSGHTMRYIIAGLLLGVTLAAGAEEVSLATLHREHPRLLLTRADWAALKACTVSDQVEKKMLQDLCAQGDKELNSTPIKHELIGPRLLDKSRTCLGRVTTLATLYRLTGKAEYAARARKEMMTAAEFKDWNPSHFLDVAEMTTALALGYDWLYDVLPPDERKAIKAAIIEKGLKPGLGDTPGARGRSWLKAVHNWNQVCNGGLAIGALALADEEPELALRVLKQSLGALPLALASYAPDGGWNEGPGYWDYATTYTAYIIAALESALGKDFGLKRAAGLDRTGFFHLYSVGPQNRTFNFADAGDRGGPSWAMFWLAKAYQQPVFAADNFFCDKKLKGANYLLWLPAPVPDAALVEKLPPSAFFRGVDVAFLRSGWDSKATFVGFKAGDNKANHSHLDLGTFVLDMRGQRWCEDLGSDEYNLPGYFGKQRWTYYRLMSAGHNVCTLAGANQEPKARAAMLAFDGTPGKACAVADLTAGYAPAAKKAQRGVMLLVKSGALVQDESALAKPQELIWAIHTPAKITLAGREAKLTQKGETIVVRILEPAS